METGRHLALRALSRWRKGAEFADRVATQTLDCSSLGKADRAFALELFYGVLRNLTLLDFWVDQLRSGPLEETARDLLRLGLYQIMLLETPAHAAVFETVALAPPRLRSLVNAVLRRALRERDALTSGADAQPLHVRYSEPDFLIEKWRNQFGDAATLELCRWNNRPAPIYARINRLLISVPEFLARHPGSFLLPQRANFVGLTDPAAATRSGECYIQDPSTTLACELLSPRLGETVLDACAAPGGKSAYLAEMMNNQGVLVAADRDQSRLARVRENLVRLKVGDARIVLCDWTEESSVRAANLAPHSFDKILVDAPCANTGVMRRRVDVRWRLRPDDFARMAREQLNVLRAVVPLLKPGGSLVYSTCSLEPEENRAVVGLFLKAEANFSLTIEGESLPFRDGFDGAYAALFRS